VSRAVSRALERQARSLADPWLTPGPCVGCSLTSALKALGRGAGSLALARWMVALQPRAALWPKLLRSILSAEVLLSIVRAFGGARVPGRFCQLGGAFLSVGRGDRWLVGMLRSRVFLRSHGLHSHSCCPRCVCQRLAGWVGGDLMRGGAIARRRCGAARRWALDAQAGG
jgi:hypothetical protein